ncbi:DUF1835 domain-containing protein [Methylobacterium sp. J-030]|uniref:DUF3658 domain-containing protein n=1 Tax=Methylobacterium sp. J-030 TaxID=2836627 RepID=UPI001FBBD250|nr:DUF3658 domain-containing protein [Methylobacterium sp. J-030]MCJ2074049.1 DUF1835 domain-containing protein [Methylobacterium sp. J-030]
MTDAAETIHVAWGVSRAESVREALRLQGCAERVIALSHALTVGPIASLDGQARRAWLAANTRDDDEDRPDQVDLEAPWAEATAAGIHPVFWVCRTDAAEHACLLAFAARMAGRPFDIVDATGFDFTDFSQVSPIWSLGQLRPGEIVASGLGRRRRPFARAERDAAAAAWAQLRRENAPLRILRDGRLVSAPLTQFDAVLVRQAAPDREPLIALVARTLRHLDAALDPPGQGCSHELLFARILALGRAGKLEVTGPGPGMRAYAVRRPAAHAPA